jgi:hypothetical protein
MKPTSVALFLALTTPCAGCYSTWEIGPRGLPQLNGYRAPERREIVADNSDVFVLDQDTELGVYEGYELKVERRFTSIDLAVRADGGPLFLRGTVVPTSKDAPPGTSWWDADGKAVAGPLPVEVRIATSARAKRYSPSKTAALVIPLALTGTGLIVFGVLAGLLSGIR